MISKQVKIEFIILNFLANTNTENERKKKNQPRDFGIYFDVNEVNLVQTCMATFARKNTYPCCKTRYLF